ncbi:MAG: hypothetical protein FJW66_00715 [Actinobacteria bacterium]|nr:hypothetical protein [Actinomycetota bacterium]
MEKEKKLDYSFRDTRTVLFTGVKGGCGCSFIANTVAAYLAQTKNVSVVLVDFNTGKKDSRTVFNLTADSLRDLGDIACDFSEIDISLLKKLVITFDNSLNLVLPPVNFEKAGRLNTKNIEILMDVLGRIFDLIIVDFPFYLFFEAKDTFYDFADKLVFVSNADFISISNLKLLIDNIGTGMPASKIEIVVNRFNFKAVTASGRIAGTISLPVKTFIPYDRDLEYLYITSGPFPIFNYTLRTVRAISDFSECLYGDLF